jgi:hypothetical protein
MIKLLSGLLASIPVTALRTRPIIERQMFDDIFGYEGIKRTFLRSINSKEPVHLDRRKLYS